MKKTKSTTPMKKSALSLINKIKELLNRFSYTHNENCNYPDKCKQALIEIFKLLDVEEINVNFTSGNPSTYSDDLLEYKEIEICSRSYSVASLYEQYEKEMKDIENIIKEYINNCSDIDIESDDSSSYIGECGTLCLQMEKEEDEEEIHVEKYSYKQYIVSLCTYVNSKNMNPEEVEYIINMLPENSYDCEMSASYIDEYNNAKDENKRKKAIEKATEVLIQHGIVPNGVFDNKELYKIAGILLKYSKICKQKTEHLINIMKQESLIIEDGAYTSEDINYPSIDLIIEEDKEDNDKLSVEIRYHVNIPTYEPLDEIMDVEFDACDENDTIYI